jgi:hypothetical protein
MLVDKGVLWFRVLDLDMGLREGGRRGSSWWREIVQILDGVREPEGGWFGECVTKKVGDG